MYFGLNLSLGGVGSYVGSQALAYILYTDTLNNFVYQTDGSGNIVIDNQGSNGVTNDLLMVSGRGIELGATNTFTVTANYITWFDITTKSHKTTTTSKTFASETVNSILASANEVNASDLAILDANPNLLGKLGVSIGAYSISELNVALTASDQYFMCSEKEGAYLVDVRAGYGSELVTNGTFDTNTTGWRAGRCTISSVGGKCEQVVTSEPNGYFTFDYAQEISFTGYYILSLNVDSSDTRAIIHNLSDVQYKSYSPEVGENTWIGYGEIRRVSFYGDTNGVTYTWDNISIREATAIEIANYTGNPQIRTNADQLTAGIQTTAFTKDALNVPTAYDVTALNWDGGEGDTQWNPSLESAFWIEEIIDGVVYQHKYDGTNLTTYTDNVAGTPALHSPENADYLFGKGVYPKVTADPYTENVLKAPSVIVNDYSTYDQTARYAILASL